MRFTLIQLNALLNMRKAGTLAVAARLLNLTSPTITSACRRSRRWLRPKLLLRSDPRFQLTAQGHALSDYAHRIHRAANEWWSRFDHNRHPGETNQSCCGW